MNKIRIATNDMALTVKMSDEQANVCRPTSGSAR